MCFLTTWDEVTEKQHNSYEQLTRRLWVLSQLLPLSWSQELYHPNFKGWMHFVSNILILEVTCRIAGFSEEVKLKCEWGKSRGAFCLLNLWCTTPIFLIIQFVKVLVPSGSAMFSESLFHALKLSCLQVILVPVIFQFILGAWISLNWLLIPSKTNLTRRIICYCDLLST